MLRIDDNLRKEASDLFSQLGLDLPTAMKRMSRDAEKAGVADMTLEEINAEIAAVRSGKESE